VRNEEPGAVHHVVPQGNGRRPIVFDDRDRHAYLERFHRIAPERCWTIHASCLLDTHHHAVVETPAPDLSDGMRRVLGGHAAWLNTRHGRSGAVFGERFWSTRIYDDAHLVRACLYALLNPVAAGAVSHPREWPWSSYRTLIDHGCTARLSTVLGDTPQEACTRMLALVDEGAELIAGARVRDRTAALRIAEALALRSAEGRG
jgi:REP element-mobilizing transposase RayT